MDVYDRAVRTVPEPERLAIYELYLAKASEFFGIGKARRAQPASSQAHTGAVMRTLAGLQAVLSRTAGR